MSEVFVVAIIAGGFTLAGVFAGALLEPFKLRASAKARTRQERAERCAKLIESAQDVRDAMSDLVFMVDAARAAGRTPDLGTPRSGEIMSRAFNAYMALRPVGALLALSGPDDLASAAAGVVQAARRLAQPDAQHDSDSFPRLRDALVAETIEFIAVARKHVS